MKATIKRLLPWWMRIGAKLVLARLPVGYSFWKSLGLFEHGDMNQPARALETYLMHAKTADLSTPPRTVLELGPGDSVFTAMIANAMGAVQVWLVDAGAFATNDPLAYEGMSTYLRALGYSVQTAKPIKNITDVLTECNAQYLTGGVDSLVKIPDQSIDFCFSNAVLEHVPKHDFPHLAKELKRILKPSGVCVHRVDLKDHLGGGLNNLRFSEKIWEGPFFSRSGFYTNRIRYADMLSMFEHAGFTCVVTRKVTWDVLPIARSALAKEFQALSDANLLVSEFDVVLRHKVFG